MIAYTKTPTKDKTPVKDKKPEKKTAKKVKK